jgi:hypothetical protein
MSGFELGASTDLIEQAWSDGHCPKHGAFRSFPATQECHWCRCEAQARLLSSAPTPKRLRMFQEVTELYRQRDLLRPFMTAEQFTMIGHILAAARRRHPAPGSDRTKRLRKKRAKSQCGAVTEIPR